MKLELGWFDIDRENTDFGLIKISYDQFSIGLDAYHKFISSDKITINDEKSLETLKKNLFTFLFNQTDAKAITISDDNFFDFLKPIIILNSVIPWIIWKYAEHKNDEFEFIDTFRYGISTLAFGLFYMLQTYLVSWFLTWKIGLIYLASSFILLLIYSKTHPTPAKLPLE